MPPELTVQIVNFRTRDHLGPCVESLLPALAATGLSRRIAILENGSGEDLSAFAEHADISVSAENLGFGGGHNRLASGNASPLLCLVNPDIVCDREDVLVRLLAALEGERVVAAGPLLRTPAGAPQRFDHGELRGLQAVVANGAGRAHWRPRERTTEVAWVSGAFLLVRRAAFEAAGGFDEDFFLYKEEEDLCLRLRRAGGRILYVPEASAMHVGSVVAGRDPELLAAADARFEAKHAAGPRGAAMRALYSVTRRIG
jgi:GT2 family glycosyltransferase